MIPLHNILVPVDFSPRSVHAVEQAAILAQKSGSELILFHAYHRPMVPAGVEAEVEKSFLKKRARSIENKFEELIKEVPQLTEINYSLRKTLGKSTDSIIESVEELKIDLIVMGSKGAHGFDEIWGSNAAKVAEKSKCPVLILPDQANISDLEKIGFACDFEDDKTSSMLDYLPFMAKVLNARINVIYVSLDPKDRHPREYKQAVKIHRLLEEVPHSFDYVYSKNVEDGLINYCKDNGIGLLTTMPKSRNIFEKLFSESLTKQMVYHIDVPMLILK